MSDVVFSCEFLRIRKLADGIFAVLGDQFGACNSNAGIIDLGDQTLVFDTLNHPKHSAPMADACRELTGRDPSLIVISHSHADHWLGNQVFPRTTPILSTHDMFTRIDAFAGQLEEAKADPSELAKELKELAQTIEQQEDENRADAMRLNHLRWQDIYDALPMLEFIRPTGTYEGKLVLNGETRSVELIEVHGGHSPSDVYLACPEDKILFMGDLGFFDAMPFLGHSDPIHWAAVLGEMLDTETTTFVPGHGAVGGPDAVKQLKAFVDRLLQIAGDTASEGLDISETLPARLEEPFKSWALRAGYPELNYKTVFEAVAGSK